MELREFLEGRLAEDQKIAEDAYALDDGFPFWIDVDDEHHYRAACTFRERLGPARVLRDVEAKRRLLNLRVPDFNCNNDSTNGWYEAMGEVERLLAIPYSDHPDYNPSWSPEARV